MFNAHTKRWRGRYTIGRSFPSCQAVSFRDLRPKASAGTRSSRLTGSMGCAWAKGFFCLVAGIVLLVERERVLQNRRQLEEYPSRHCARMTSRRFYRTP